jgi:hypothetical protein
MGYLAFPRIGGAIMICVLLVGAVWGEEKESAKRADPRLGSPLPRAHAHNDYHHDRPLLDALERGFCSVEADIYLVGDNLMVGHSRLELRKGRTLQNLYLDPLARLARKNKNRIYADGPTITLLVDIKTDGVRVYARLREVLAEYQDMLSYVKEGEYHKGAVQIVISGDRPRQEIAADKTRYVGIDGRLGDLDSKDPAHLVPLISDRWSSHFKWRGQGEFPQAEREKLESIVRRAHAAGRRVRFWATPENPAVWRELDRVGVDHINTDKLDELREYLLMPAAK